MRATLRLSSPAWLAQPRITSSIALGSRAGKRSPVMPDRQRGQIVGRGPTKGRHEIGRTACAVRRTNKPSATVHADNPRERLRWQASFHRGRGFAQQWRQIFCAPSRAASGWNSMLILRRRHVTFGVAHRHGERAQPEFQFLLDPGVALSCEPVHDHGASASLSVTVWACGARGGSPSTKREAWPERARPAARGPSTWTTRAGARRLRAKRSSPPHRHPQHIDDRSGRRAPPSNNSVRLAARKSSINGCARSVKLSEPQIAKAEFEHARAERSTRDRCAARSPGAPASAPGAARRRARDRCAAAMSARLSLVCSRVESAQHRQPARERLHVVAAVLEGRFACALAIGHARKSKHRSRRIDAEGKGSIAWCAIRTLCAHSAQHAMRRGSLDGRRTRDGAAQLVRAGRLGCADRRRRPGRAPAARRRPRILDMSSLAECSNLGHQHPTLVAAIRAQAERLCFVTNAWGAAAARASWPSSCSSVPGSKAAACSSRWAARTPTRTRSRSRARRAGKPKARSSRATARTTARATWRWRCRATARTPASGRCRLRSACPRAAAVCVSLPVRQPRMRTNAARAPRPRSPSASTRSAPDSVAAVLMEAERRHQRHRRARQLLAGACARSTAQRGVWLIADEVMSALRPLRRMVRLAAPRRGGPPGPDDARQGSDRAPRCRSARSCCQRDVAARIEHEMLYTGLTYCGHPLSCAAGVAALDAYDDEGLIERSRTLGARMFDEVQGLQSRHPVIGDVRGGHGLFAVVELVADRATRAPLAPWPQTPPALKALVDEAHGRRRVLRHARQPDPARAAAGDRGSTNSPTRWRCSTACWRDTSPIPRSARDMSFRLTYATMFNPPAEMHVRFEAALARLEAQFGQRHPLFVAGADREPAGLGDQAQPDRQRAGARRISARRRGRRRRRDAAPRTRPSRPGAHSRSPSARRCCARSAT